MDEGGERKRRSGFFKATFGMASDHGKFAFRSSHQPVQICGLGRDPGGKPTGCKTPAVIEALGISFDYKRQEAFAESG
jgi:hypothetical protein